MVQWIKYSLEQQFLKYDVSTFVVQKSGVIHLVQPGLTASWLAG